MKENDILKVNVLSKLSISVQIIVLESSDRFIFISNKLCIYIRAVFEFLCSVVYF